jgi:phosphocarrier protein FPr
MASKTNGDPITPSWNGETPPRPAFRAGAEELVLHQRVVIQNPEGLHMRPATAVAQAAKRFNAEATLIRGDLRVNARSAWDILLLSAAQGAEIEIEVRGPEADGALAALVDLLSTPTLPDEERALPPKG